MGGVPEWWRENLGESAPPKSDKNADETIRSMTLESGNEPKRQNKRKTFIHKKLGPGGNGGLRGVLTGGARVPLQPHGAQRETPAASPWAPLNAPTRTVS